MIPDVSDVLTEWAVPVKLKTVTETTVDFEPVVNVAVEEIKAVVQPPTSEQLTDAEIDWSKQHLTFHSTSKISIGQYIEYQGKDYKIITDSNWQLYGYSEVIGEETKRELLTP